MQTVAAKAFRLAVVEREQFELVVVVGEAKAAGAEPVAQQVEAAAEFHVVRAAAVSALFVVEPGADEHLAVEGAVGVHDTGRVRLQFGERHVGHEEAEAAFRQKTPDGLGRAPPETAEPLDLVVAGLRRLIEGDFEILLCLPPEGV